MGEDCMMAIERKGDLGWEIVGLTSVMRDYAFFDRIRQEAALGWPPDVSRETREILEHYECYGQCWMPWEEFLSTDPPKYLVYIRKKVAKDCRVVFRFDNRRGT